MKKIPTLFKRDPEWMATPEVTPGFEWVLRGEGVATIKYDGSCTMIKDGKFYKRYDAKRGKKPPAGAIPCQEKPDPVTGHWPHWVEVGDGPEDKWFREVYKNTKRIRGSDLADGTFEAMGPHFQGNPENWHEDILLRHGSGRVSLSDYSFGGIRSFLEKTNIEGIVIQGNGVALPFWTWLLKRVSAQYERPATLGSLFDGQGSFPLAWMRLGNKAVWSSEIEKTPQQLQGSTSEMKKPGLKVT